MDVNELIRMYKIVLDDMSSAIGFIPEAHANTLSLLKQRIYELETIWSIPDVLWNAFEEEGENGNA